MGSQASQPARGVGAKPVPRKVLPWLLTGALKAVGFMRLFADGFGMKPAASVRHHEGNEQFRRVSKLFSSPIGASACEQPAHWGVVRPK